VLALLTADGSAWTATSDKSWTRADGTRITLGDGDAETQVWTVVPAT